MTLPEVFSNHQPWEMSGLAFNVMNTGAGYMKRTAAVLLLTLGAVVIASAQVAPHAPEIDPGSIGTALALVSSVFLMTRRPKKR